MSANYNSIDTATSPLDLLGIDYATSTYDAVHGRAPLKPPVVTLFMPICILSRAAWRAEALCDTWYRSG